MPPTSLPAAPGSDVGLLDTTAIPILGVMPNASLIKLVFINVSTGNTNFAQSRPDLPKSYPLYFVVDVEAGHSANVDCKYPWFRSVRYWNVLPAELP